MNRHQSFNPRHSRELFADLIPTLALVIGVLIAFVDGAASLGSF